MDPKTIKETLFTFKGRINRPQYILGMLFLIVLGMISLAFSKYIHNLDSNHLISTFTFIILTLIKIAINLLIVAISFSLMIRRLHDLNKSGWYVLIAAIPIICILFGAYLIIFSGTKGPNKYGEDTASNNTIII